MWTLQRLGNVERWFSFIDTCQSMASPKWIKANYLIQKWTSQSKIQTQRRKINLCLNGQNTGSEGINTCDFFPLPCSLLSCMWVYHNIDQVSW